MHTTSTTLRYPRLLLLIALGLGFCAEQLFYGRALGISLPIFVGLCLAALLGLGRAEERLPTPANLWMGGAALVFACFLALRDEPLLTALNFLACLGLLLFLVMSYRGVALARLPGWRYLSSALLATLEMAARPVPLAVRTAASLPVGPTQARRLLPVGRGLVLALPVLFVFTGLLMAADSIFASYVVQIVSLRLPFDLHSLIGRGFIMLFVGWGCAGALLVALRDVAIVGPPLRTVMPAEGDTQPLEVPRRGLRLLGSVEALTVLSAVNLLFGSFMLIQGAYFFGGLDTLQRTGMTYADYARRGFFELLTVACLSLGMLWTLALTTRRDEAWQRRAFNLACAVLILLVIGLLASAFQRMQLYEAAYGYTRLRIYTLSFMLWLALALLLFLAALLRDEPRIFTFGGFVTALLYLALLNVASPDAMIVRENVARYAASGKLDAYYLTMLSADATPELTAALPMLDAESQAAITSDLNGQREQLRAQAARDGWPGWHIGRAGALAALDRLP